MANNVWSVPNDEDYGYPGYCKRYGILVGASPDELHYAFSLAPSSIEWGLQDISGADSGRTQDINSTMFKLRRGQKRKLKLTWTMPNVMAATIILKSFNQDYFYVQYFDPMAGEEQIRLFYAGDRTAPFKWLNLGPRGIRFTTISFDIIER